MEQKIQKESTNFIAYVSNFSKANKLIKFRLSEKMHPNDKRDFDFVLVAWELTEALAAGNQLDVKQIQLNQIINAVRYNSHNFLFGKGW